MLAHGLWKDQQHQAGREFVQQLVLRMVPVSQPGEPPATGALTFAPRRGTPCP